ncbi:type I restriction endonuclease [uncultured Thiohalocapsa sp.]|uniref:type I restriction endonuclease subunit R n=1 Tax=uncultured Thiohalocapsa sp. TaxID=768990 RepID=UPI0025DC8F24|nr:type I restriction endonuclease [uncultured Thiohalocapsa sp.]
MATDTSEQGLEALITDWLVAHGGYAAGNPADFDREHALDLAQLLAFLRATQPEAVSRLNIAGAGPDRRKFLARLSSEIGKRGVLDVLRRGIHHGPAKVELYYATPSPQNPDAAALHTANRFTVTRQLRYSTHQGRLALDLCIFINGLPVATFELKNRLTKQNVGDAVEQYQRDRDPGERLFQFGRCMAHFAVDDQEVRFCTELKGEDAWFLPFNKGWQDGAGNPPNPQGLKTDYLWREVLCRPGLIEIVEHFARIVEEKDEDTGRKRRKQIFPRWHQRDAVHCLLQQVEQDRVGHRYLVQHSAGSGKSNTIAWTAHRLTALETDGGEPLFHSVIVVTDRILLDRQIRDSIRQFVQVPSIVAHAAHSAELKRGIEAGTRIIVTTVQKFPVIVREIGSLHRGRRFAILIDEAHSSQGGRAATQMNMALSESGEFAEGLDLEEAVNLLIASGRMLPNASYFAFTATPKPKTLEVFGERFEQGGEVRFRPHHTYSMKQAIEEGFIVDVLAHYTPVQSFYRLATKLEDDDPEFDTRKAQKKLRRYVEGHDHAIRRKAEIIVDHFLDRVMAKRKLGGEARAMVVTAGIERAIDYYYAVTDYLIARQSPWRAIVAFSGEKAYQGAKLTEASLNGFPSNDIKRKLRRKPYRFLIVADKFQTGYDEPLLHSMYVDKELAGIQAVQTLSRLNRADPRKHDTFVLDFYNDADAIERAFQPFYQTTLLSGETDPNRLHDLKAALDAAEVYTAQDIDAAARAYLDGLDRETHLDPVLDACAARYTAELDEDAQIRFKGDAKAFCRSYGYLSAVLSYGNPGWEKLAIFLPLLLPKLPAPRDEDLSRGILEAVNMDSYRAEMRSSLEITLQDADGELDPYNESGGGGRTEPELAPLSEILRTFNERWGNIEWKDSDRIERVLVEELPAKIAANEAYRNAMRRGNADKARIELEVALKQAIIDMLSDHADLFKAYSDEPAFRGWLADAMFNATYRPGSNAAS